MVYPVLCFALLFMNAHSGLAASLSRSLKMEASNRWNCPLYSWSVGLCKKNYFFEACSEACQKYYVAFGIATTFPKGNKEVYGTFRFYAYLPGEALIRGTVWGLDAGRSYGLQIVYTLNECRYAHFGPQKQDSHGSLDSEIRHAGDLGNIVGGSSPSISVSILVKGIELKIDGDARNPIGRASLVIFEEPNDYSDSVFGGLRTPLSCGPIINIKG